ncbi:FHA domain-containing protein [Myxococcus landrumensis]|uniref:FHA domain-containing protein n=1 Tax=Myxococcus landrumensis TaxID=2813577 RepID=A0ABX7N9J0_9BACT|nr:FHA domain-containing protein [Myxococcus landrumus]QSQ15054.1 FHA domain-containing protein [Myxococcus landrumus]
MLPLVIRIKGLDVQAPTEKQYVFRHSPVRIGRNQLNDVSIPKTFVSLFHALVRFDQKAIYVVDLGSTNGVSIDGRRIDKNIQVKVDEETRISIGTIEMRLSREAVQGDGQSQMTQFRALTTLMDPGEGTPSSFKPTPVQGRAQVVATALLPALGSIPSLQDDDEEEMGASRTQLMPALEEGELGAEDDGQRTQISSIPRVEEPVARPAVPSIIQRRNRTPESVRVVPPGAGGVHASIQQLVPLYTAYRNAWQALHSAMVRQGEGLAENERPSLVGQIQRRLSGVVHEPQFGEFARSLGVAVPQGSGGTSSGVSMSGVQGAPPRLDVMARELLGQFVRSYLPGSKGLESGADIDRFLERLAGVLETFGRAFVELRQGHDQFGQEMAVAMVRDVTPLSKSKNTREVLRYLLDWKAADGAERVQELKSGFGDVMIHQIALLNGMREGVRALLQRLSQGGEEGEGSFLSKLWPFGASTRLKWLEEEIRRLSEEERELTKALFGQEFAKAYHAIVGDAANKGSDGEVSVVSKRRERES